jgi:hypothetical protein
MRRTRGSFYYLAGYLYFIGGGFLLAPSAMLFLLMAEGIYSMVTLRLMGALMLTSAILLTGVIEQSAEGLYRQVLRAQAPWVLVLGYVYYDSLDRLWALLLGISCAGWLASLYCYWHDGQDGKAKGPNAVVGE